MKYLIFIFCFFSITPNVFSQFTDTSELNQFLRDTIRDRRPNKVTVAQIQKAFLGISNLLPGSEEPVNEWDSVAMEEGSMKFMTEPGANYAIETVIYINGSAMYGTAGYDVSMNVSADGYAYTGTITTGDNTYTLNFEGGSTINLNNSWGNHEATIKGVIQNTGAGFFEVIGSEVCCPNNGTISYSGYLKYKKLNRSQSNVATLMMPQDIAGGYESNAPLTLTPLVYPVKSGETFVFESELHIVNGFSYASEEINVQFEMPDCDFLEGVVHWYDENTNTNGSFSINSNSFNIGNWWNLRNLHIQIRGTAYSISEDGEFKIVVTPTGNPNNGNFHIAKGSYLNAYQLNLVPSEEPGGEGGGGGVDYEYTGNDGTYDYLHKVLTKQEGYPDLTHYEVFEKTEGGSPVANRAIYNSVESSSDGFSDPNDYGTYASQNFSAYSFGLDIRKNQSGVILEAIRGDTGVEPLIRFTSYGNAANPATFNNVLIYPDSTTMDRPLKAYGGIIASKLNIPTYTPTSSSDTEGEEGDITRDDLYIYQKTSTGWKRSATFTTF